jgi:hypothetical protein
MRQGNPQRLTRQLRSALDQCRHGEGLPFAEVLEPEQVREALQQEGVSFRDRLFSPLVTLYVFLSQIFDADHSCRQAVARFLAWRVWRGQPRCSADTSAYCKARQRLPEGVLRRLTRTTGQRLQDEALADWRWHARDVKFVDGSTVSMPDTPANQEAYPQPPCQKPGLGFPLVRMVVVFSLAVGAVLETALGRYQGKQQGEPALFRTLHDSLQAGDVLLADRYYCSYWEVAWAVAHGVDMVLRLHQRRKADFRRGRRLGRDDHVVSWSKPKQRPAWMDAEAYATLPATLTVREVRVRVRVPGFRTDSLVVVTTLLDATEFPAEELATLYRARWQAELDLRSLKVTLQMDILRGKSPEMIRKEIWGHLLAYNLIRTVMARAAEGHACRPEDISFKGTLQTLNAFEPCLRGATADQLPDLYDALLEAVATHVVGDRPDRCEPRARKRRPKPHRQLTVPREQARKHLLKGN